MKSWLCNCSRLNPDSEHRCLSCKTLRPDFSPKPLQPLDPSLMDDTFIIKKVKQIREVMDVSELRMYALDYVDALTRCLSPSQEPLVCVSILTVTKDEVWMKTSCGNACLVFNGRQWAEIIARVHGETRRNGFLSLIDDAGNPPAGDLEEKQKYKIMEEPIITLESGKEKSKYVKAELLERALTMWLHQREEKFKNQDVKDHLLDVFRDVFPEISFQQIGDKIILL